MPRRRLSPPMLFAIAVLAVVPALGAQAGPQAQGRQDPRDEDRREAARATLSEAVRRAERDTRGEVLSAERVMNDGRELHRVKVVDDRGRVRVFTQDPQRAGERPPRPPRDDDN